MSTGTGVSFALDDEQKELRALAREFADEGDPPGRGRARRRDAPPGRGDREGARARPDEPALPVELRRPRPRRLRRHARRRGAELGLHRDRHVDRRERPRRRPGDHRRQRRAEGKRWLRAAPRGADPLLVRALRAGRRLGRRAAEDDGRAARRRVRPQRLEDVHHERRLRRLDGRLREDRRLEGASRDLRVHRPDGRRPA